MKKRKGIQIDRPQNDSLSHPYNWASLMPALLISFLFFLSILLFLIIHLKAEREIVIMAVLGISAGLAGSLAGKLRWKILQLNSAEKRLAAVNSFLDGYRRAVEESSMVAIMSPEGIMIYVNDKFCENLGYARAELIGKQCEIFKAGAGNPGNCKTFLEAAQKRHIWHGILERRTKEGRRVFHDTTVVPMADEGGDIIEIIFVGRDVTELNNALEKAQSAEKAKSGILAFMSHEIRTPLSGVMGFIKLLGHTKLNEKQYEFLRIIESSANSLLGIINNVLDLSKIENGKIELEEAAFSPQSEFDLTAELFAAIANEKRIDLISFIDPTLPDSVIGDSLRIKQVLINLLSNAIKFTPKNGTVNLEVINREVLDSTCNIHFMVSDTGIGIPENKQKLVFQSFSQADSSITRKFGGTGLGLAIGRQLVDLMGGELKLESEEGKGSAFYFDLALKTGEEKKAGRRQYDINDKKIALFVPPSISRQENLVQKYLSAVHCTVKTFSKMEDLAAEEPPDLFLFVYSILTKDRLLECAQRFSGVPILAIAREDQGEEIELLNNYINLTVSKPVVGSRLFKAIEKILRREDSDLVKQNTNDRIESPAFSGNILLAEDDAINRKLVTLMLEGLGVSTDAAANGREAVEKFKRNRYDLVLMDVSMPVLNGFEATKEILDIEKRERLGHTSIIAVTAYTGKGYEVELMAKGMDGRISKPFDLKALKKTLQKYLPSGIDSAVDALGLKTEIVKDLIAEFTLSMDENLKNLEEAVAKKDLRRTCRIAHTIKGSASNLRLKTIVESAAELEKAAENGSLVDYLEVVEKIKGEVEIIRKTDSLNTAGK